MKTRLVLTVVYLSFFVSSAYAASSPEWYVNILGENFHPVSGASVSQKIVDGVFLDESFVGNAMYVRVQENYELEQYGKKTSSGGSKTAQSSMVAEAAVSAATRGDTHESLGTFGPITDSGLAISKGGDFLGWWCSELFITPLGKREYKLSCPSKQMKLE